MLFEAEQFLIPYSPQEALLDSPHLKFESIDLSPTIKRSPIIFSQAINNISLRLLYSLIADDFLSDFPCLQLFLQIIDFCLYALSPKVSLSFIFFLRGGVCPHAWR